MTATTMNSTEIMAVRMLAMLAASAATALAASSVGTGTTAKVLVTGSLPQLRALDEHVLGGAGMELGVTWEGASGEAVVAIDVEPCLVGGKKSLDDFPAACQPHRLLPIDDQKS